MPEAAAQDITEKVELSIGGQLFTGWKEVRISRSIDSMAGQFSLVAAVKGDGADADFTFDAGAACAVKVGGETIIQGWVDQIAPGYDSQAHEIAISGRDRSGDLADCSAVAEPGSWSNTLVQTIATSLAAPYGIAVHALADTGKPIRKFAVQQGESVHDAIERLLRYRGLILVSQADGSVAIVKAASGAAQFTIPASRILQARAVHDVSGRYSDYLVKGQASGSDDAHGRAVSAVKGTATDPAVKRKRILMIIGEEQSDGASLTTRAKWEATVRAGRSQEAVVTVAGWRTGAGALFNPNTLGSLKDEKLRMAGTLLVTGVELVYDASRGTVADLTLSPPEAWSQMAVPEDREASRVR